MGSLRDFFDNACLTGEPLVAAWIIATEGSTYRKPGALMLFTRHERSGLLSGGCLEGDLHEHARRLLVTPEARLSLHRYDSRGSDDPIWGLGLGCEGLMQVLLLRCTADSGYEPVKSLLDATQRRDVHAVAIDLTNGDFVGVDQAGTPTSASSRDSSVLLQVAIGRAQPADSPVRRAGIQQSPDNSSARYFSVQSESPASLLVCGAGPDVEPVFFFARQLGWQVTIVDHRPAYIDDARFIGATRLLRLDSPERLADSVWLNSFSAALVMSHHLQADGAYLATLADSTIPYIGLLGPAARRERLFAELGAKTARLRDRLRAPVGLDIGAQTPEEIALAIITEVQACLRGRTPRSFTTTIT